MCYNNCNNCLQTCGNCNCNKVKADTIIYTGPELPCTFINTNDDMDIVVQKLSDAICYGETTTTTTTAPTCYTWEAILTSSGTLPPTVTVVDTNFPDGYIIGTERNNVGLYYIHFAGLPFSFTSYNTEVLTGEPLMGKFYALAANATSLYLETSDNTNTPADGILGITSIFVKYCTAYPITPTTTTTTTGAITTSTTTLVPPTTTSTTTAPLVYPVVAICCGRPEVRYVFSGPILKIGEVVTSITEGFLGGYEVVGDKIAGTPDIILYNGTVFPGCSEWGAFWGGFGCV